MRRLLLYASSALIALSVAPAANATLAIWADINGTIISCTDGAACDTNSAPGQLTIADQTVAGVQFTGSSQNQVIGPPQNSLNTSSFQVINNSGGTVSIEVLVGGTGFAAPIANFAASGAGTFQNAVGSALTLNYFIDTANTQGALGGATPGTPVANFSHSDTINNPDSFAFDSGVLPFSAIAPFSMTEEVTGTLIAGGELVGRTQAIINTVSTVPEPASLLILGASLVGLGGIAAFRRRRWVGDAHA